jgi:enoyl-CoA hydratase
MSRFLIAPDAAERLSPLDGPGVLILDLVASRAAPTDDDHALLLETLPTLPCVTIAIGAESNLSSMSSLAGACDVVLPDDRGLAALLRGFEKTPLAALAFVQLLRNSESASIHAGLIAESFVYSTLQSGHEFQSWLAARRSRPRRARATGERACRLDRDRNRLEINLSRPEKKNAFSASMRDDLVEALQLVRADPSIEEVVLRGDGDAFCSGGDLDEFGSFPDPVGAHAIRSTRSPAMLIARLAGRIRAEVHGACIGAGVELPAFLDRVVAQEDSFFQLPEVGLGLVPGAGGSVSLPRRIGRQRTAWLGLSGSRIDARTALDWGLVDEVRLGQHH